MRRWMRMLFRRARRERRPDADERYLAQSADAQDLEIRLQALERRGR